MKGKKLLAIFTSAAMVFGSLSVSVAAPAGIEAGDAVVTRTAPLETPIYKDASGQYSFAERAADLVSRMTVAEKASQSTGSMSPAIPRLGLSKYQWWNEALHGFAATSPETAGGMGVAPSYGTSVPNSTSYPQSTSMASSWDPALYYAEATQISDEIRERVVDNSKNLNMYSPNVNLQRDPRWGRNEEAYSEDPYLTGVMGSAFVNGMEGRNYATGETLDPNGYKKVSTTIKHYTANNSENNRTGPLNGGLANAANGGVEGGAFNVDYRAMREYFTAPYRDIIQNANVGSVMTAYSTVNGLPVSMSSYFMDTLLRQTFGFGGFITSDCDSVQTIANHRYVNPHTGKLLTKAEQYASALAHGEDLECNSGVSVSGSGNYWVNYPLMLGGVKTDKGVFTENQFDISVHRLMTTRMQLGEFDGVIGYQAAGKARMEAGLDGGYVKNLFGQTQERLALAENLAENSVVMLKNAAPAGSADKILPVKASPTADRPLKVAVIGQWARTGTYLGQYSSTQLVTGESDSNFVTIERGIIAAMKAKYGDNVQVDYYRGFSNSLTALASLTTIAQDDVAKAAAADLAVVVLATEQATSREGNDRATIKLPGAQAQLASAVGKANPNTIVILETCGPVQVTSFEPDVAAILWSSFGGVKKGVGFGKIITGAVNPSGKTQQLWYNNVDNTDPASDITGIYDYDLYESEGHPGRTYMYYSGTYQPGGVSYPFGYGLSFTTFEYSNLRVNGTSFTADDTVEVTFDLKNTGNVKGKEVAELYFAQPGTALPNRPIKRLKGFQKVELNPGETKSVTLKADVKDLAYFDTAANKYVVDEGAWQLQVGAACNNIALSQNFSVTRGQITEKPQVVTFKPNQTGDADKGIAERLIYNKGVEVDPHTAVSMNNEAMYGYIIANNVPGYSDMSKAGIVKVADIPGTVTYSSNRPEVAAVEGGKIVTKNPGVATITATVTYNGASAEGEFVVLVLSDPGPASIAVGGTPIADYDPSNLNYSIEIPDGVTAVPVVTYVPSDDTDVTYAVRPAAAIPGVTEIEAVDTRTGSKQIYRIGFAHRPKSADFKTEAWAGDWTWQNQAVDDVRHDDTGLSITARRGAYGTATPPANVYKQAAGGDWVVKTHLTLSATPGASNQQAGLIVWDDDQNYIRYVYERPTSGTTNVIRVYQAVRGTETQAYTANLANARELYLQIQKVGGGYSFAYSQNDVTWTRITTTLPVAAKYALPYVGLLANTGDADASPFTATYEYLNVFDLTQASPTLKTLTINGEAVSGFVADSNAKTDFSYAAKDFAAIPVIAATADAGQGLAVSVKQAESLPGMATVTVSSAIASTNYYVVFDELPVSDTFIAGVKDGKWTIINPSAGGNWSIEPGKGLRLPTQRYDMSGTNTAWQDLFARPGGGDWEILAKVYYPEAPGVATQNMGLYVYQDSDNFVKIDARFNANGPRVYVTTERAGTASTTYASLPVNAVDNDGSLTVYYIVTKNGDSYNFRFATNPSSYANFVSAGTPEIHLVNPQIALLSATNSATAPVIQTYCEYVVYKPLDGFTTWADGYLAASLDKAFADAVSVMGANLPESTEGDLEFALPHGYRVEVVSTEPTVIDAQGRVTPAVVDTTVGVSVRVFDQYGRASEAVERQIVVLGNKALKITKTSDTVTASVGYENAAGASKTVALILAFYDAQGRLIGQKASTASAPAGGAAALTVTADLVADAVTAKAFVWNAVTFAPLMAGIALELEN
ncbi:MAG: glycoside hydrolase family 3 C-terminal domain-containing protein [Clostridiales Family XIII bacterium]|jgi:beta-glucosidase|nr:glycoside hydrolase family 3 C-terminal domain-containing protein [Clostridiales Family XIII bacterium]